MSGLYDYRWQQRRAHQLAMEPLCRFCEARGLFVAATVADHVVPHRGDPVLFEGPLQSLCAGCHSARKQMLEQPGKVPPHASWAKPGGDEPITSDGLSRPPAPLQKL